MYNKLTPKKHRKKIQINGLSTNYGFSIITRMGELKRKKK